MATSEVITASVHHQCAVRIISSFAAKRNPYLKF